MPSRAKIEPIATTIPDERQKLARHYGVHPYFTRRSANVIQAYIRRFTSPGDVVVDPFGGSGVTAIEAFLLKRVGVQNDVNPLANFLTRTIADTTLPSTQSIKEGYNRVEADCKERIDQLADRSDNEVEALLRTLPLPENIALPRSSDAGHFLDLFTPRQCAALALLKRSIIEELNPAVRDALLLAWSATASKLNKTFISAKGRTESRGGSSIFSIYRYKLAKSVVELPLWETFRGRLLNVLAAKAEVLAIRDHLAAGGNGVDSRRDLRVFQTDAAELSAAMGAGTADYVFTDPPYGAYIAYLDLSILWNHWLGFDVTDDLRHAEAIVGGELRLTEDHYKAKLAASIGDCVRLLKPDRWMSVVFQHWDASYFQTILDAAVGGGTELKAAVTQEREVIWSMHKKKNSESVIGGEMILTFYKPARDRHATDRVRHTRSHLFCELLDITLKAERAPREITSQYLFNRLILLAWQHNSLKELAVSRQEFAEALRHRGWTYDAAKHLWRKGNPPHEPQLL
jgi:adenine-specific DNA methylase